MLRILIGGSPCTYWSIAQTKDRETEPSGMGWELFLNFLIALEKYKPDYFLYENNKSMSAAIRAEITKRFGFDPVCINSALVSAQSRQRLYWVGRRDPITGRYHVVPVAQPADRGILLRDILESGIDCPERVYAMNEPIYVGEVPGHKGEYRNGKQPSQQYRVYSVAGKSVCLDGDSRKYIAEPIRVCNINGGGQGNRIYSANGKSCAIKASTGGAGGHGQGLYAVPCGAAWRGRDGGAELEIRDDEKSNAVIVGHQSRLVIEAADKKHTPVYEVRNGQITIGNKRYSIKLPDGFYIIRRLTVRECKRLQTVPEWYVFPVSAAQAYKMLGNGWTVDVIAHIMSYFEGITTQPVEVLSMYDGMSCGHIALDKLGSNVVRYYATEIDKYAIQTTQHNYPETVQLGDTFQVRSPEWRLP